MPKVTRRFIASIIVGAFAAVVSTAGCATAVDRSEVEQKANPVKELHAELQKKQAAEENALKWYSYEDALVKARQEGKFVMIDFYAQWCKWCKRLDSDTYSDPRVAEALKAGFVPVKIDAESGDKVVYEMRQITKSELADKYQVAGYPSVWFLDKDGNKAKLLDGYLGPDAFLVYLEYVRSGAYKDMEFADYVKKHEAGK